MSYARQQMQGMPQQDPAMLGIGSRVPEDEDPGDPMLGLGEEDENAMEEAMQMCDNYLPAHERLYRSHTNRVQRKSARQDSEAEWRKHAFAPDIRKSQVSGPAVVRSSSYAGLPQSMQDGYGQVAVATSDETD